MNDTLIDAIYRAHRQVWGYDPTPEALTDRVLSYIEDSWPGGANPNAPRCDATRVGRKHCSDDLINVYHGYVDPAIACGYHAAHWPLSVADGHRVRLGASVPNGCR